MSPSWFPKWGSTEEKTPRAEADHGEVDVVQSSTEEPFDSPSPVERSASSSEQEGEERLTMPLDEDQIMEALKEVYDPELAINIVDLGLVYEAIPDGKSVTVRMTLTSPGCPVGPMIQALVDGTVRRTFPHVEDVKVELVWNPPWDPYTMASEEAKDMLGIW